jgi:uncharacterized protein (DUF4415 family)
MRVVDSNKLEGDSRVKARVDRELAALTGVEDEKIDLSDAPELPAAAWENAIHGMDAWLKTVRTGGLYKPMKQSVSMRLDADVVSWLKQRGPGYQTRANQILREKMLAELAR